MSHEKKPGDASGGCCGPQSGKPQEKDKDKKIHCRRVDATYTVSEHASCPYCFGKAAQVATGDHRLFCDFKPGEDPICFGFPEDFGRHTKE